MTEKGPSEQVHGEFVFGVVPVMDHDDLDDLCPNCGDWIVDGECGCPV